MDWHGNKLTVLILITCKPDGLKFQGNTSVELTFQLQLAYPSPTHAVHSVLIKMNALNNIKFMEIENRYRGAMIARQRMRHMEALVKPEGNVMPFNT